MSNQEKSDKIQEALAAADKSILALDEGGADRFGVRQEVRVALRELHTAVRLLAQEVAR